MKLLLCLISKTSNCCPGINDLSKIFVSLAACLNVFLGGAMHRSVSQKVKQIPSWSDLPPHPRGCVWDFFRWWGGGGGSNPPPNRKKATQNNNLSFKKEVGFRPAPPPGWDKIPTISETLRCMAPLLVEIVLNLVWLKAVYNGGGFWKRRDGERNPDSCCPIWWTNHHHRHLVILLHEFNKHLFLVTRSSLLFLRKVYQSQ